MEHELFKEETIYSVGSSKLVENSYEVIKNAIKSNDAVGFVTGRYDEQLSISNVSGFFLHNLGYDYEEFVEATKGSLKNLFYGENKTFLEVERFKNIQGEGEGMILTKGKVPVYARLFKKDSIDKNGEKLWILSVHMDWMQQNLQLVNNVLQSGFWVIECDEEGRAATVSYSHEFRKMLGYNDSLDFPNTFNAWTDLIYPQDKESVLEQLNAALADKTNQTKYNVDYRMKIRGNKYEWFRDSAEITRRLDGTACRMAGIFINIEKQKEAKRQQQRSNAFHRAYTESNLCEYYVNLKDDTYDSLKKDGSLFKNLEENHTFRELVEQYIDAYVCPEDKESVLAIYNKEYIINRFLEGAKEICLECKISLDGEKRWVRNVILEDGIEDHSQHIMVFIRDITDAKREAKNVQKLTEQNQAMDMMIQGTVKLVDRYAACDIVHDSYQFFNPSTGKEVYPSVGQYQDFVKKIDDRFKTYSGENTIKQMLEPEYIQQVLEGPESVFKFEYCTKDEKQFKSMAISPLSWKDEKVESVLLIAQDITQSSRHLLGLINEVLDMSRIESGKISLSEEEFNLSELVDNLVTMIKPGIEMHKHHFEVHLGQIEHEDVCGDSLRIQQLITNIMSNAIKYTPDGGNINFEISEVDTTSPDVGCYKFTIEDNGMGMSEEFQKVIFEPFTRADDKRTSKIQGTGLGMAIAKNIASMMNGSIEVESELLKGTKFTVTIYLKLQHKELKRIDELIDLPVLVVDDDLICCENTVDILKDIGIDGEWVTSGKEAIMKVKERYQSEENYFAIIIDWQMPEMDGIETARQIRKHVGRDVTIIILSAFDYSEIEEEARAAGVDDFIAKPLFRSRLTATLKNIIEGKPNKEAQNYLTNLAQCDFSGKNILLVEDNMLNSEIASEIIAMTGANIDTAENGKEALEKFSNAAIGFYDLIFMDIQMPTMNGYEATAAIRSLKKYQAKQIPIVAMTANAFAEDVILAKNAGMDEHIAKPLEMNRLCEVMQRYL